MKVTDLMVGDYICLDGDVDFETPIKIQQIGYQGENDIVADNDVFGVEDLVPIPLTEEILVKNGFEKQGDLYQYHINAGNGYTRIDIIDLQDGLWSYDIDVYDKFADAHKIHHDDDCFLKLHQLQHLLRLCGIQKEIEL